MKAIGAVAGVALLTGSGVALAQASGGDPVANWQAVVACAGQTSAAERHACIDGVLRAAGVLDPVREQQQQRADFGRSASDARQAAPAPAPLPAPVPSRAAPPAPTPAPAPVPERIDRIATTIAAARIGGNGKLLVATAEATVWRQTDGETFRIAPSPGTAFEVERGALGSYICKVGRSSTFRCTRVD